MSTPTGSVRICVCRHAIRMAGLTSNPNLSAEKERCLRQATATVAENVGEGERRWLSKRAPVDKARSQKGVFFGPIVYFFGVKGMGIAPLPRVRRSRGVDVASSGSARWGFGSRDGERVVQFESTGDRFLPLHFRGQTGRVGEGVPPAPSATQSGCRR